jgi:Excalibur calcium-binding domain
MRSSLFLLAVALAVAIVAPGTAAIDQRTAPTAGVAVPRLYDNCTNFNRRYAHGVGKRGARDRTKSGRNPVTNFLRSTLIYNRAMRWNDDLDRDRDGVACEKH